MSENQKSVPNAVDFISTMVESQKSMEKNSEATLEVVQQLKSIIEGQAETKSAKDAMESMKKEIEEKHQAEIKSVQEATKELEAQLDEMRAKKSVNVGGATAVKKEMKSVKPMVEEMCEGYILGINTENSKEDYKNALCDYLELAKEQKSTQGVATHLLNEVKTLVHNTNDFSIGGILLNAPIIVGIQERLFISSPLRQNATILSGRTDTIELILSEKFGEASFMSEGQDFTEQKIAELGVKQIRAMKVGSMAKFSDKIDKFYSASNRLGINFVSYVTDKLVRNIAMKLEQGYMQGADVQKGGKIEGFTPNANNSFEKNSTYHFDGQKIGYVKSGNPAGFTIEAFSDLEAVFPQEFSQGAVYIMNPKTLATVKKFKTTTNQPIFNQNYGIGLTNGLIQGELMGRPVIIDHYCEDVASDAFPIGLVNIRDYYTIYDAYGDTLVEKTPVYGGVTTVNIRAEKYSTGMIADPQAAVFLKIAS